MDWWDMFGDVFSYAVQLLNETVLFYYNVPDSVHTVAITLWDVCVGCIALCIFRDFLELSGVWDYGSSDLFYDSYEDRYDYDD